LSGVCLPGKKSTDLFLLFNTVSSIENKNSSAPRGLCTLKNTVNKTASLTSRGEIRIGAALLRRANGMEMLSLMGFRGQGKNHRTGRAFFKEQEKPQ
jgi:hypothetical protein